MSETSAVDVIAGRESWAVEKGESPGWMESLPADCCDLLVCSPPYVTARTYLEDGVDLGIARGPDAWVAWMVECCEAARRVCQGLCVFVVEGKTEGYSYDCTPFLLIADLKRRGFTLRKPPIYRRVGIPGSGGPDWLRNDWEPIVCFTRGGKLPWSDNAACGHPPKWAPGGEMSHRLTDGARVNQWGKTGTEAGVNGAAQRTRDGGRQKAARPSHIMTTKAHTKRMADGEMAEQTYTPPVMANPGNVIQETYTAQEIAELLGETTDLIDCKVGGGQMGSPLCHDNEAPFPETLATFFIRSFCPPGGLVCDPFSGSGTTGACAVRWGRRFIGADLRPSQVALSRRRISQERWDCGAPPAHRKPRPADTGPSLFDSLHDQEAP